MALTSGCIQEGLSTGPFRLQNHALQGHAFEARLYAESVANNFLPATGTIRRWQVPPNASLFDNSRPVRVDSGVSEGDTVRAENFPSEYLTGLGTLAWS